MATLPTTRPFSALAPFRTGNTGLGAVVQSAFDPAIAVATLLAVTVISGLPMGPAEWGLALLAFVLSYPGDISFRARLPGQLRRIAANWGLVVGVLLAVGVAFGALRLYDIEQLAVWVVATPIAQVLAHWAGPTVLSRVSTLRRHNTAIVIGANAHGRMLVRSIQNDPMSQTRFAAYFDDRETDRLGPDLEVPMAGRIDAVVDFVRGNHIDQIYIALPMASQPRILKLLDQLRDTTASIYFLPDIFLYDLIQARVDIVGGMPVMAVCETPFFGTTGIIKRIADLAITVTALVLTAPLMVAIAIAIKTTMPGPVLFKQRRYGLDGREIIVWKFRTMKVQEDGADVKQATKDDDRVTPLGRLLRRTSIDELPQFFNVLQGRMSVVGPRPHAVAHNEMYRKLIKGYMIRHKVKPGITGWAQVNGARGETDTIDKMKRRIEFDLEYLRNWSLRLDLQIVVRTVVQALRRDPNVY
jgi:putative colanic acid biosysnthesis UDP-glucose lipid carrier transferase